MVEEEEVEEEEEEEEEEVGGRSIAMALDSRRPRETSAPLLTPPTPLYHRKAENTSPGKVALAGYGRGEERFPPPVLGRREGGEVDTPLELGELKGEVGVMVAAPVPFLPPAPPTAAILPISHASAPLCAATSSFSVVAHSTRALEKDTV